MLCKTHSLEMSRYRDSRRWSEEVRSTTSSLLRQAVICCCFDNQLVIGSHLLRTLIFLIAFGLMNEAKKRGRDGKTLCVCFFHFPNDWVGGWSRYLKWPRAQPKLQPYGPMINFRTFLFLFRMRLSVLGRAFADGSCVAARPGHWLACSGTEVIARATKSKGNCCRRGAAQVPHNQTDWRCSR